MSQKLFQSEEILLGDAKPKRIQRSRTRKIGSFFWSIFMIAIFIVLGFQIGGFARYAYLVTTPPPPATNHQDGIVVLTGGENRLHSAIALLTEDRGKRVLITGINPTISDESLRKIIKVDQALFDCCIDTDRSAENTVGNAIATGKWVKEHHLKTLIVVTGAFHMPRTIKELSHAIKDVEFIAHPVNVPDGKNWWRDHSRVRDMLREYGKFMVMNSRDVINEWSGNPWPTMPMSGLFAPEKTE